MTRLIATDRLQITVVAGTYISEELVRLVGGMKYQGIRGLGWPLSRLLAQAVLGHAPCQQMVSGITAVPLHWQRRLERGFNQAAILGRLLAQQVGLPYLPNVLRRVRATAQQARIAAADPRRQTNVRYAFQAREPATDEPRDLLLVDDLITSGATILGVGEALAEAGWRVGWGVAAGLARSVETGSELTGRRVITRNPAGRRETTLTRCGGVSRMGPPTS
ncbi:MAG: hypothetical protein ABIF77_06555 [bacterium]